jgi:signal peptidase II
MSAPLTTPQRTWCMPHSLLVLAIAGGVVALDQITKQLALTSFQPGELRQVIDGIFNLTLSFNRGAAFGLWSGLESGWREVVLASTILLALAVVGFLLTRPYYQSRLAQGALAAILGGAIGNVIDRFVYGAVIDFLDFYLGSYHWPAFNIADSAICIGVGLLLFLPKAETASLPQA